MTAVHDLLVTYLKLLRRAEFRNYSVSNVYDTPRHRGILLHQCDYTCSSRNRILRTSDLLMGFVPRCAIKSLHLFIGGVRICTFRDLQAGLFYPALNGIAPIFLIGLAFHSARYVVDPPAKDTQLNLIYGLLPADSREYMCVSTQRIWLDGSDEFITIGGMGLLNNVTAAADERYITPAVRCLQRCVRRRQARRRIRFVFVCCAIQCKSVPLPSELMQMICKYM